MKLAAPVALVLAAAAAPAGAQRAVGDVFHAGDERNWLVEQEGKTLGHSWSRYEGEVELLGLRAHLFRGQVELALETPGGVFEQRYTTDLWTDERGHPLRFLLQGRVSDVYSRVEAVLAEGKADLKVRQGPKESEKRVDFPAGGYLLANNFAAHLDLLLALDAPGPGKARQYTLFSANAIQAFPYTVTHVEERAAADPGGAAVSVFEDSLGERLHLVDGRLERVEVPAQKILMRRVQEPFTQITIEPPVAGGETSDLEREDVRIADGEVSLAGTITRPKGAGGRLPALFFVSGSGGQDRDGVAAGIDLGTHEILDRLTRDGFLVLRVDDRGVGESTGPLNELTFDDLVEDARRAVGYLLGRDDVDPARVAVIGHSEGGETAPLLATSIPEIAAIVLMAGPGRPIDALLEEQLLRARREAGAGEDELAELEFALADFLEKVRTGAALDGVEWPPEVQIFVPARAWLRSHTLQDPIANLKKVRCPVLILQGERDIQVSAERDAPRLLDALEEAGHEDHELIVFPGLDHLFKKTVGERSSELDYLKTRPVAPEFLDKLSGWLRAHLMRTK